MNTKATRDFFEQSQLPASIRIELYMGRGRPRRDYTFDLLASLDIDRKQPTRVDHSNRAVPTAISAD